jgi:transposase
MALVLDDLPRDPDRLLQHLRQMAEVVARQNASLASLRAEHDTVLTERDAARTERDLVREQHDVAQAEIEKLRLLIRQLQRGRFGRRSEKLDPDQLQLGLEDLEQTVAAAEAAQEAAAGSSGTPRTPRVRRRNLGSLPAHLPRIEVLVDVEDKSCPCCGGALHAIGEDTSEMLDIVPAVLRVKVVRRPRYGCRACEEAVVQAPAPERPITGGMATEALLAHVLVAKYADFLPLYRQAQIFARQGIELDRSTLCDWVGRACWWLEPLWRLLRRHVMSSTKIFADDTTLPVLDPGRGRTKTGRLWGYAIDDRPWCGSTPPAVVYLYAEDRRGEHPAAHLAGFRGILQVDGYGGFKSLLENRPPGAIRLAFCWAHCRRRFYEIHQATGSPLAEEALRRIGELYKVEAEVRGRPAEERRTVRQERSKPIVEALHVWLTAQLGRVSGKSGLAEAIRYALRHWQGLVLFVDDGRLELDTNVIERAIRPIALGRKNSLFAGSDGGARHWAIVASLVATAKLNGVEPLAWLTDVLERMVSGRIKAHELERLLPWTWKAERLAATADAA